MKRFLNSNTELANLELKELALKSRLNIEFYKLIVYTPSAFQLPLSSFRRPIEIGDDFAQFLDSLIESWNGCLEISIENAVSIILDSIESNTFW